MDDGYWYAADALMANLTNHHHHLRASSEAEVGQRMRDCYPEAVAIWTGSRPAKRSPQKQIPAYEKAASKKAAKRW